MTQKQTESMYPTYMRARKAGMTANEAMKAIYDMLFEYSMEINVSHLGNRWCRCADARVAASLDIEECCE